MGVKRIVHHFGHFSLISPLTSLLNLAVQPPVMTAAGLAALAATVRHKHPF